MKAEIYQYFVPLSQEDIEEKIELNKIERGYSLIEMKELLEREKYIIERELLLNFDKHDLHLRIQKQCLKEQIDYINNKLLKGER